MTDKIIKESRSVLYLKIPVKVIETKENYEIQTIGLNSKKILNILPKTFEADINFES